MPFMTKSMYEEIIILFIFNWKMLKYFTDYAKFRHVFVVIMSLGLFAAD